MSYSLRQRTEQLIDYWTPVHFTLLHHRCLARLAASLRAAVPPIHIHDKPKDRADLAPTPVRRSSGPDRMSISGNDLVTPTHNVSARQRMIQEDGLLLTRSAPHRVALRYSCA